MAASIHRLASVLLLAMSTLAAPPALAAPDLPEPAVRELRFGQFFRQPVGPAGLEMGPALVAADGQRVRIVGYMVAQESPAAGRFLLTPRPVRMSEHADGDADDLPPATLTVLLDPAQRERIVAHHPGLVALTGRLSVGREEDAQGRVSWVRLALDPDALADRRLESSAAIHAR